MQDEAKTIRLEFFAQFREDRGLASENVQTRCRTAEELYAELDAVHHFHAERAKARVAVNDAIVPWNTRIGEGDTVVFLTPFGGG